MYATRGIIETTRPALIIVAHRRGSPVVRGIAEAASQMHVPTAALVLPDFENGAGERAGYPSADGGVHVNVGVGTSPPPPADWASSSAAANAEASAVLAEAVRLTNKPRGVLVCDSYSSRTAPSLLSSHSQAEGVFGGALSEAVPGVTQAFAVGASAATPHLGLFFAEAAAGAAAGDLQSPLDAPVLAAYAYATASPGLLLRYVEDLLCACEKGSSAGVGAYAQCPWRTPLRPTPTPAPLPKA